MNLFKGITDVINTNYYRAGKYQFRFTDMKSDNVLSILNAYPSIIKSIQLPDFTANTIESFSSNKWHIALGRTDVLQISVTLYSVHSIVGKKIDVYHKILKQWKRQKEEYPDALSFSLSVINLTQDGSSSDKIVFKDCLIQSVSGKTVDSSIQNEISEFSMNIIAPKYSVKPNYNDAAEH